MPQAVGDERWTRNPRESARARLQYPVGLQSAMPGHGRGSAEVLPNKFQARAISSVWGRIQKIQNLKFGYVTALSIDLELTGLSDADPVEQYKGKLLVIEVCHHPLNGLGTNWQSQCSRCVLANVVCDVQDTSACIRCSRMKQSCSLMPKYQSGRTIRRPLSPGVYLSIRTKQAAGELELEEPEAASEVTRGKRRARDSPDAADSEGSGPVPVMTELVGLKTLSLHSGNSSPANTPADGPTALPQPPLHARPDPAPPSVPSTSGVSKSLAGKLHPFPSPLCHLPLTI
jgi:hypothetical protein